MDDKLLTTEELCQWFKVSRRTITTWRQEKGLPFLKIGKAVRFEKQEVEKWITKNNAEK